MDISPFYPAVLTLSDLRFKVNLGVTAEEREKLQEIHIDFKFFFADLPKAVYSDSISQTICYFTIAEKIQNFCQEKNFNTLEYLCHVLHGYVREQVDKTVGIWMKVCKHYASSQVIIGPACFEYGDCKSLDRN